MTTLRKAQANAKRWRSNPKAFVDEQFKVTLDRWQEDALDALTSQAPIARRRLALKACTGPGKSAVLAWIGWWRLSCFAEKGEHPKGAALSGEGRDNLRDNLWSELGKWQERSEFLKHAFTFNQEQIYANDHRKTWFLSARSYPKSATPEQVGQSLSGLHSRYPFVLLDETGAMPVSVGQRAEQIFTGGTVDGLIAQSGNPTTTQGLLYHSCVTLRDQYIVITITADPEDPKRTPRVDIQHATEQIGKYGRDNPWIMSTILGLFPPGAMNALLGLDDVEAAMSRHYSEDRYGFSQKRLGVDAARFGDDPWVLFPRQGLAAFKPEEMRSPRTEQVVARIMMAKAKWDQELEFLDGTGGFAGGVVDGLRIAGETPHEVSFSGKADDPRYFNKRAEIWFRMAEWVKAGGALPNLPILAKELPAPTYYFHNGTFRLEEKEQIKKRLGFSPNYGDALALTFTLPDMPAKNSVLARMQESSEGKMKSDYDPFAEDRY